MLPRMRTAGETNQYNTDRAYHTGVDQWNRGFAFQQMQDAANRSMQQKAMDQQNDLWWKQALIGGASDIAGAAIGGGIGSLLKPKPMFDMNSPEGQAMMMKVFGAGG